MAGVQEKVCPLCEFRAATVPGILSHLRIVHSSDPHFSVSCGLDGCATTATSFSALYSHIYRHHPQIIQKRERKQLSATATSMLGDEGNDDINFNGSVPPFEGLAADIHYLTGDDAKAIQHSSALFLLKLKEHRRISQVAINDIVEGTRAMVRLSAERMQAAVRANLASNGIDPDTVDGLGRALNEVADPFEGIQTCHLQEQYYHDQLGLVDPIEIKIGDSQYVPRFSGSKRTLVKRWDTYHYIPLLSSLEKLLSDSLVVEQIDQLPRRISQDGQIRDFCDGKRFKEHPLFSKDLSALQIIAYFDEVEICNPLGSHVKQHKLGLVYFTLGNIAPKHRSQLKVINLAIVVTIPVIEVYGLDKVLQPFISDLNILATTGVTVTANGLARNFKGALLTFLADNLASNQIGGFKQSFSFSYRYCRTCLVTQSALTDGFVSEYFQKRTKEDHTKSLKLLEGPAAAHFSKTYGINSVFFTKCQGF